MNTKQTLIESTLKESLRLLNKYPDSVEELQRQLHEITSVCQNAANYYHIPVIDGVVTEP